MCQAIQEMIQEGYQEGNLEGMRHLPEKLDIILEDETQ